MISRDVVFVEELKTPEIEKIVFEENPRRITANNNEENKDETIPENIDENSTSEEESENEKRTDEPRRSERSNKGVPPDRFMGRLKMITSQEEPKTRTEALSRPDKSLWIEAMNEEMKSLENNKTWDIVIPQKDINIVGCKWVYKIKRDTNGQVLKYKARLVAKGFSQKYGKDYNEVFVPVVRPVTFRSLLVIAGRNKFVIKHYDAKTAFLNGNLKETVYMSQPEGYEKKSEEHVCRIRKSLYGLKQAAKVWHDKVDEILKELVFEQSEADPCLYFKRCKFTIIYLIIYVDDILIVARTEDEINQIAVALNKHFQLSDLGHLHHYLGIQVEKLENIFCIHQSAYIQKVATSMGLQDAKYSKIPLDPGHIKARDNNGALIEKPERYQQLIGALLYIAVNTRPDIAASVTILSQFNKRPIEADWIEAKRIVRYLMGTKELKLQLGRDTESEALIGYADADWAENNTDRKSNSGYVYQIFGGTISWACRKQTCIALSSTEAEYISLAEACQEGMWIQKLLQDLLNKETIEVIMYEDNQSCLKMISNFKFSNRTKHIDTKYHFVKHLQSQGLRSFKYCPTELMIADLLTKPLKAVKLNFLLQNCGLQ